MSKKNQCAQFQISLGAKKGQVINIQKEIVVVKFMLPIPSY